VLKLWKKWGNSNKRARPRRRRNRDAKGVVGDSSGEKMSPLQSTRRSGERRKLFQQCLGWRPNRD